MTVAARHRWLRRVVRRERLALGLAASLGGHAAAGAMVPAAPSRPMPRPVIVEMEMGRADAMPSDVVEEDPPPLDEAPATEPPPPSVPQDPRTPPSSQASAPSEPAPSEPAPPDEAEPSEPSEPVALTGVTLSGDDGAWSSALGDGSRRRGPLGPVPDVTPTRRGKRAERRAPPEARSTRPAAAREVALAALADKPRAPNLDAALRRLYPPAAREQQLGGEAAVRVRIGPHGVVTATRLVSESSVGFGAACQAALAGSSWSPPRDGRGRAVATWILYRCMFQLAH